MPVKHFSRILEKHKIARMGTSTDNWEQRIQSARDELLSLPQLKGCRRDDELRSLTRCHLQLTARSNDNRLPLSIDELRDKDAARQICLQYRADVLARVSQSAKVFLHSDRIVSGYHAVAPQLAFLAEVCTVQDSGRIDWWSRSDSVSFAYRTGPVATHIQTDFREPDDDQTPRRFLHTPLLSAAAFNEDLARITTYGAQLAIGHGKPSYILYSILRELGNIKLLRTGFEPSCVSSLKVEHRRQDSAVVQVATTWLGTTAMQVVRTDLGECVITRT
jgi:hypothetical protein